MKRAACALLLCLALPAQAYVRSRNNNGQGPCIWWPTHGHSFQIDAQGSPDAPLDATYDAIRKSFQTWAAVSCSDLNFSEEPLSTSASNRLVGFESGGTNHNLVLFRTRNCAQVVPANDPCKAQGGCGNAYDCWEHGDGIIATTTTTSKSSTGEILDSDIEMNDAPSSSANKLTFTTVDGLPCTRSGETGCVRIDVQNTVTHEAGHSLGLDHTLDPAATMYASAPSGEKSKRVLGADDIAGICAIYPRGAASVTCTSGQGGGCSAAQTDPGAALAALAVLLQIRRRSRRRPQLPMSSSTNPATAARCQSGIEN